jgi:uncharacterized protein (TIGR02452 family)
MTDYVLEDCLVVASNSYSENPAVLIYASHKRFGGGYKRHSKAQEEWCFNRTSLPEYDGNHTIVKNFYPLAHTDSDGFILPATINGRQREVQFIFVPAPVWNLRRDPRADRVSVLRARAQIIFDLARTNGIDHLVLGGWGCGVFGCPPKLVAQILKELTPSGMRVTYAFLDKRLLDTFKKIQK